MRQARDVVEDRPKAKYPSIITYTMTSTWKRQTNRQVTMHNHNYNFPTYHASCLLISMPYINKFDYKQAKKRGEGLHICEKKTNRAWNKSRVQKMIGKNANINYI